MSVQDLTLELGMNVSTNVLQPAAGDLIVLTVPSFLSNAQRDLIDQKIKPPFVELGCKFLVLEGGIDVLLVKKADARPEPVVPSE